MIYSYLRRLPPHYLASVKTSIHFKLLSTTKDTQHTIKGREIYCCHPTENCWVAPVSIGRDFTSILDPHLYSAINFSKGLVQPQYSLSNYREDITLRYIRSMESKHASCVKARKSFGIVYFQTGPLDLLYTIAVQIFYSYYKDKPSYFILISYEFRLRD